MKNIRNTLAAAGLSVVMALIPACGKSLNEPKVRYKKQDNGLCIPLYEGKVVRTLEAKGASMKIEIADLNGDNKPDLVIVTRSDVNGSVREMFLSSRLDGNVTRIYVDDSNVAEGHGKVDGYWDFMTSPLGHLNSVKHSTIEGVIEVYREELKHFK